MTIGGGMDVVRRQEGGKPSLPSSRQNGGAQEEATIESPSGAITRLNLLLPCDLMICF